jgi:hypothetical protein
MKEGGDKSNNIQPTYSEEPYQPILPPSISKKHSRLSNHESVKSSKGKPPLVKSQ